jgi:serine/threonine protein kinase
MSKHPKTIISVYGRMGSGMYGDVYKILKDSQTLALKIMPQKMCIGFQDMLDSVREMYGLHNAGLLQGILIGFDGRLGFMMPPLGSSLASLKKISVGAAAALLRPIAVSANYMSGMHRDIKPANILLPLTSDAKATLVDFSLCTNMTTSRDSAVVTLPWRAPEVLLKQAYTKAVDVWAFGITFLNLLTGNGITRMSNEENTLEFAMDIFDMFGWHDTWPESIKERGNAHGYFDLHRHLSSVDSSPESIAACVSLISGCLRPMPSERLTWAQVLEHPLWTFADSGSIYSEMPCLPLSQRRSHDFTDFISSATTFDFSNFPVPTEISVRESFLGIDAMKMYASSIGGLSDETIFKAYHIWTFAPKYLYGALFLAMAFNEDLRTLPNLRFTSSMTMASVLGAIKCSRGIWPQKPYVAAHGEFSLFLAVKDDLETLESMRRERPVLFQTIYPL